MKICIILNGEIKEYNVIEEILKKEQYDYIICADGGANHAYYMNITPHYIVGDLDSVDIKIVNHYKNRCVKFEQFPSKKNETDTELCIYLADKLKAREIHFIGALGGRIDHTIANVNLLYYVRNMNIIPRIISEKEYIYIAHNEEITIDGNKDDIISIIPINGNAKGVTLTNLEYPLNNYDMKFYLPLGMSNVMLGKECKIKVEDGSLFIIRNV